MENTQTIINLSTPLSPLGVRKVRLEARGRDVCREIAL